MKVKTIFWGSVIVGAILALGLLKIASSMVSGSPSQLQADRERLNRIYKDIVFADSGSKAYWLKRHEAEIAEILGRRPQWRIDSDLGFDSESVQFGDNWKKP